MQSLSKILFPVDFSERSVGAAQYARTLAAHFGSELVLLHALAPPQFELGALEISGSMLVELYRGRAEQAAVELDKFLEAELAGLNVRRVVLEGEPAARIVSFAHQERADLIIMPTHGYGRFRRFILGSNTAKVLHDADCAVWTGVHMEQAPAAASAAFRAILCGVDLGPQSSKTLFWAAMLAREFGARLTMVHATGPAPDRAADSGENGRANVREAAERELLRLQRFVNVEADLIIEAGEAATVLCSAAQRVQADVLAIGRGSAAGVFGRLRTNAYAIIRQSPCPVVSV
ncbi:MAG: universal stress protein [Bryobacteraceae bacterium]|jgi:nucleotide-binding universal stress UspA family protein